MKSQMIAPSNTTLLVQVVLNVIKKLGMDNASTKSNFFVTHLHEPSRFDNSLDDIFVILLVAFKEMIKLEGGDVGKSIVNLFYTFRGCFRAISFSSEGLVDEWQDDRYECWEWVLLF